MVYTEVSYDNEIEGHWNQILNILRAEFQNHDSFDNAKVSKVWTDKLNFNEILYQFHVKAGHFPHHKHFTVLAEARQGIFKVLKVQEG
jgi:hypothetical protein